MREPLPSDDSHDLIQACHPAPADLEARRALWQAELRNQSDAFRRAFEDAATGMAIVDLDGHFQKVNRSLCEIVGYDESELLAMTFQQLTHREDLYADLVQARRSLSGEIEHYRLEKRYIHKRGHDVWIILSGSLIRSEDGSPCYFVSQMQDITARKSAEQQAAEHLRSMQRLTQAANQILRVFESGEDDEVLPNVLEIALTAFDSKTGLLLRVDESRELVGPYKSYGGVRSVRCPADADDLWMRALTEKVVVVENASREMGCGETLTRSLVGPILYDGEPLGLVHLADASYEYSQDDCELLAQLLELIAPALHARMRLALLTSREAEVMDLIVRGMSQKQIATMLEITVQTVAKHRARVLEKLSARGDVDLVYFMLQKRANQMFDPGRIDYHGVVGLPRPRKLIQPEDIAKRLPKRFER